MSKYGKVDEKKLTTVLADLEKAYGQGSVYSIDSEHATQHIPRWSTGIEDLDEVLGGGMPYGRIIEIFGPESSGKTSLAYHLMAQHDAAVDVPIEGTFDVERAKAFGNRGGQLFVRRAEYGEQCIETILEVAKANLPIIVVDSVPHMKTRAEFEQPDVEKEGRRGRTAAMLADKLPKVVNTCERSGTTVVFINQLRDEMGAMMFGPKTHTPGGWALRHACSIRIQVNRMDWIKIPYKQIGITAKVKAIGITMRLKVVKSKVCNPLGECVLAMIFDRGFVSMDDVAEIRKELMKQQNAKVQDIEELEDDEPVVVKKKKKKKKATTIGERGRE